MKQTKHYFNGKRIDAKMKAFVKLPKGIWFTRLSKENQDKIKKLLQIQYQEYQKKKLKELRVLIRRLLK